MSIEDGLSVDKAEQEQTPEQIFSEMSKAVADNDYAALDRLAKDEAPLVEAEVDEVKKEEEQAEVKAEGTQEIPKVEEPDEKDKTIAQLRADLEAQSKHVHQLRSDAGRVPALQRRLAEVDRKLQEMALKPTTAASAREDSRVLSEKLAQIKEADPLLAEAVEESIKAAIDELRQESNANLAKTQEVLQQRVVKDEEEFLDREYDRLVQAVPNAPQVFAHPLWAEWKTQIPPNLLALATSAYADEVMLAMEQFGKYVIYKHPELAQQQQQAQQKVEEKPAQVKDPAAEKLEADRAKKLKTPTPGTSTVVVEKDNEPTDPEKLFQHFYKLERKTFER